MGPQRQHPFVADGRQRLRNDEWYRRKEREVRQAVAKKYESRLATAGPLDRILLRLTIWREARREMKALAPEDGLYLRDRG